MLDNSMLNPSGLKKRLKVKTKSTLFILSLLAHSFMSVALSTLKGESKP